MNWFFKGRDDVIFETAGDAKKHEKLKNIKRFVLAAVLLIFIAVILVLKQYNFDLSSVHANNDTTQEDTTVTQKQVPKYSNDRQTFMFYCCADDEKTLKFLIYMRFDLLKDKVIVHPVDINEDLFTYKGVSGTVTASAKKCFAEGGSTMMLEASKNYLSSQVDKFIGSDVSNFANIIVNFPNIKIDISNDLKLTDGSDIVFFDSGIQEISDNNLLKFMCYKGRPSTEDMLNDQGTVAAAAVTEFINDSLVENIDVVFERIINLSENNISVIDVKKHKQSLEYIAGHSSDIKFEITLDHDEFIKNIKED